MIREALGESGNVPLLNLQALQSYLPAAAGE